MESLYLLYGDEKTFFDSYSDLNDVKNNKKPDPLDS